MGNSMNRSTIKRVAVFADVCNLFPAAKRMFDGGNLDYREVLRTASEGKMLVAAKAYAVRNPTSEKQEDFFSTIEAYGFTLEVKG